MRLKSIYGGTNNTTTQGTEALAIAADAWGNAINLVNHYDFHQFNRDYTQLLSTQTNGGGIQVAGRYIQGREKQQPGRPRKTLLYHITPMAKAIIGCIQES